MREIRQRKAVTRANHRAALRYRPSKYPGRIALFLLEDSSADLSNDPRLEWGELDSQYTCTRITGNRANLLEWPHVATLAEALTRQLETESATDKKLAS